MSRQVAGKRINDTDLYPTPSWCYENLDIDWSQFKTAHEPCCGDGRIVNWLSLNNVQTTSSEILNGKNYFDWDGEVDLILTNPPFSLAKEFIEHSLPKAKTVMMLLRLNFLGSKKRHSWWLDNKPDALYILSGRPSFTGDGTDATEYAWFVWDKTGQIPKGINFVKPPTREQLAEAKHSCRKVLEEIKNV